MSTHRGRTGDRDHLVVVVAEPDSRRRELVRSVLEGAGTGRREDGGAGAPRFRLRFAPDCEDALELLTPDVSALALNLTAGRLACVRTIEAIRPERPDLAILCYVTSAPRADAMAVMTAGADHVVDWRDGNGFLHALDLALDRRWLTLLIDRSAAAIEEARGRLARLGSNASVVLPGLRPPAMADAVLPFHAAVQQYLLACSKLFEGDARGLAERLGVSYFALRRLLKRYSVPFPGRPRRTARRARRPSLGSKG